jgi:hypothetical protein
MGVSKKQTKKPPSLCSHRCTVFDLLAFSLLKENEESTRHIKYLYVQETSIYWKVSENNNNNKKVT